MSAPEKRRPAPRWRAGIQAGSPSWFPYITTGRCRSIDFDRVNRAAVPALPAILARLLPGGRIEGHEYSALNPRRADRRLGSFKIKLFGSTAGRWCDFATGDKGGDPVSLVAFVEGIGQAEAARRLARMLGIDLVEGSR